MRAGVAVVLGTQVQSDGTIDDGYQERIIYAIHHLRDLKKSGRYRHLYLVLTGGETRKGLPTEAAAASNYVRGKYPNLAKEGIVVILEASSRTTPDNVFFVRQLLADVRGVFFDTVVFVGRTPQMPKVKLLVRRLWGRNRQKFEYIGINDPTTPRWERVVDPTIMWFLCLIDPRGTWTLWALRKVMRNG